MLKDGVSVPGAAAAAAGERRELRETTVKEARVRRARVRRDPRRVKRDDGEGDCGGGGCGGFPPADIAGRSFPGVGDRSVGDRGPPARSRRVRVRDWGRSIRDRDRVLRRRGSARLVQQASSRLLSRTVE